MSYLLTEIALEMLGYKFYDTNGIYHLTNFQLTTPQTDLHPNEKTLQTLLLGEDDDADNQPGSTSSTLMVDSENLDTCTSNTNDEGTVTPENTDAAFRDSRALANQLDIECNKMKTEIKLRMFSSLCKPPAKNQPPLEGRIKEYMNGEPKRLVEEAQMIKQFREIVEQRMIKIDPLLFAQYARTFGVTELPAVEIDPEVSVEVNDTI